MNKKLLLVTAISSIVTSGCSTHSAGSFETFQANDLNGALSSGYLEQKSNTLYVINDSSSSMGDTYTGEGFSGKTNTKLAVEKELLSRLNQTLPNASLSSGLRSFGFGPCLSWGYTKLNQGMQPHTTASFDSAINSLACSSGGTPVNSAFSAASADLAETSGTISAILISDGYNFDTSPVSAIQTLKEQYGDKFCLSTIWVGNESEKEGQAVLEGLSAMTGCGYSTTASTIASASGMEGFVKNVFFNSATPSETTALVKTPIAAENDSDNDGVPDSRDKCPNTPEGANVDSDGCWAFHGVLFEYDKATIKEEYKDVFDNAIKMLKLTPSLTVEIQGHTDSRGSESYNQTLSEKRAEAAKQHLVDNGIDPARITTKGFGENSPATSNDTEEGRAHNRRIFYKRTDM